eukprot:TRINITY_DN1431_c0_g3_i2.p1 TRINITY_DN1431_c0_g3~~TRINITY_DN1431_c0_g3_i2.p1  ORF type:complete len:648 (-),score=235.63 TRINITY_DN1431_c0_g3_i2:2740-4683(-)
MNGFAAGIKMNNGGKKHDRRLKRKEKQLEMKQKMENASHLLTTVREDMIRQKETKAARMKKSLEEYRKREKKRKIEAKRRQKEEEAMADELLLGYRKAEAERRRKEQEEFKGKWKKAPPLPPSSSTSSSRPTSSSSQKRDKTSHTESTTGSESPTSKWATDEPEPKEYSGLPPPQLSTSSPSSSSTMDGPSRIAQHRISVTSDAGVEKDVTQSSQDEGARVDSARSSHHSARGMRRSKTYYNRKHALLPFPSLPALNLELDMPDDLDDLRRRIELLDRRFVGLKMKNEGQLVEQMEGEGEQEGGEKGSDVAPRRQEEDDGNDEDEDGNDGQEGEEDVSKRKRNRKKGKKRKSVSATQYFTTKVTQSLNLRAPKYVAPREELRSAFFMTEVMGQGEHDIGSGIGSGGKEGDGSSRSHGLDSLRPSSRAGEAGADISRPSSDKMARMGLKTREEDRVIRSEKRVYGHGLEKPGIPTWKEKVHDMLLAREKGAPPPRQWVSPRSQRYQYGVRKQWRAVHSSGVVHVAVHRQGYGKEEDEESLEEERRRLKKILAAREAERKQRMELLRQLMRPEPKFDEVLDSHRDGSIEHFEEKKPQLLEEVKDDKSLAATRSDDAVSGHEIRSECERPEEHSPVSLEAMRGSSELRPF